MKIAFVGKVQNDASLLSRSLDLLARIADPDLVFYFGEQKALDEMVAQFPKQEHTVDFERIAKLVDLGAQDELSEWMKRSEKIHMLRKLKVFPKPDVRYVELLRDRVVMMAKDETLFDADDYDNATLTVCGHEADSSLDAEDLRLDLRVGPVTSGIGLVKHGKTVDGWLFDLSGEILVEKNITPVTSKMSVGS